MNILPERMEAWKPIFAEKMRECISRHPSQYDGKNATRLTAATEDTLRNKGIDYIVLGAGWKSTAKHFGIANTHDAWAAWFSGTLTPKPI